MSRDDRGKVAFFPFFLALETIDPLRIYNLASVNLHTRDSSLGSIHRSFRMDLIHLARGILSTNTCGSNNSLEFLSPSSISQKSSSDPSSIQSIVS